MAAREGGRLRDLKAFYKAPAAASSDPLDIDGNAFNSEAYLQKLYRQHDLNALMKKEDELAEKIRSLDTEMQSLVYDNYNKFIKATDTIRNMKTQVDKMEEGMQRLTDNMTSIDELSGQIDTALAPKRQEIFSLSLHHALLKRMMHLFDLPKKLRLCMEKKSYEQAVEYYTRANSVLKQYSHVGAFKAIQDECRDIINQLRDQLTRELDSKSLNQRDTLTHFDLLRRLSESPGQMFERLLNRPQQQWATDREAQAAQYGREGQGPEGLERFTEYGTTTVLKNLTDWAQSYLEQIVGKVATGDDGQPRPKPEQEEALRLIYGKVDALVQEYIEAVAARIALCAPETTVKVSHVVAALEGLLAGLAPLCKLLPRLQTTAIDACNKTMRQQARLSLERFQGWFSGHLATLHQTLRAQLKPAGLADTCQRLTSAVMEEIRAMLTQLQTATKASFARNNSFFDQEFPGRVVRTGVVQALLSYLNDFFTNLASDDARSDGPDEPLPPAPLFLLVISRLCFDLARKYVRQIVESGASMFPVSSSFRRGKKERDLVAASEKAELTDIDMLVVNEHTKNQRETGEEVLGKFVNVQGRAIAQFLRDSLLGTDWVSKSEVHDVMPYMKEVLQRIMAAEAIVSQVYDDGDQAVDPRRRQAHASQILTANLMTNIQKIFAEKIYIFGAVGFNRPAIMLGIVKIIAKSYSEIVRYTTLSKHGLQQIELNANCLNKFFARYVIDERSENMVSALMTQVISSAVQRCLDPVQLDKQFIEEVCRRAVPP
eukprot:m.224118 g.224118  ORF g.224118 m.224118 type:complete len:772 (+) comp16398_c0_seq1:57-2372(+)